MVTGLKKIIKKSDIIRGQKGIKKIIKEVGCCNKTGVFLLCCLVLCLSKCLLKEKKRINRKEKKREKKNKKKMEWRLI